MQRKFYIEEDDGLICITNKEGKIIITAERYKQPECFAVFDDSGNWIGYAKDLIEVLKFLLGGSEKFVFNN